MTELGEYMRDCQVRVEEALDTWLPPADTQPQSLHEAMRYAALGAGKRVRPLLVYAAGRSVGICPSRLDAPACAVELIHAYSLVHDDLPAMDDDDLRRGRATCHRAFDEATAILCGDALQTLAFQVLAKDKRMDVSCATRVKMIEQLALASGSRGMAGGQALDLAAVGADLDLLQLQNLHIHKTGALIRASVMLGTLGAPDIRPETIRPLEHYASCIGLAFQIRDDILDIEGDSGVIGKTRGKDEAAAKPTYPSLMGLSGAREKAEELREEAIQSLAGLGEAAIRLLQIADFVVGRNR